MVTADALAWAGLALGVLGIVLTITQTRFRD
jgi:hypothetical protein